MPRAFSEQEKQIIARRLLEEGQKQFTAYGLKKTSVEELAAAVGISKGAFYLFYESKESLLMDVVGQAERNFRQEVLAMIDQPGPTPRARLVAVLTKAFRLWRTIPLPSQFSRSDYELISRRVPVEQVREHLSSDQTFIEELIARCRDAGIPICAPAEQIGGLLYALFFASLHEDDFGGGTFSIALDLLIELVAAFCLGEIEIESAGLILGLTSEHNHESSH